jgi:hypothetical protein
MNIYPKLLSKGLHLIVPRLPLFPFFRAIFALSNSSPNTPKPQLSTRFAVFLPVDGL